MGANISDAVFLPALEQGRLIAAKEISPVELTQAYLDRIEALNPALGAFLHVSADVALVQAKEAESAVGEDGNGPLHGVPISVKDLIETAGIPTSHGVAYWKDRVPSVDAEVVRRVRAAGMPILGKTNTPQFGSSMVSEPPGLPPARNPWNRERSPGGSSGGAGAALAAALCPVALGSDGGGSVRIPSSWCGVFGIKPSRGRVSDAPEPQHWYGHTGPMARTVRDCVALFDVIAGYVTGDAFWAPDHPRPFSDEVGADPGRLRIAFTATHPSEGAELPPAYERAARDAAVLLASLGHDVVEAAPPELDINQAVIVSAAGTAGRDELPPFEECDPVVQMMITIGNASTAADMSRALTQLQNESRRAVAFFEDYDVLLSPTTGGPPPVVGDFVQTLRENPGDVQRILNLIPFTPNWNQTGQPAVSLPLYVDDEGMPIGIQLVGRPAGEATLIRLSAQLEDALPWHDRYPEGIR